MGQKECEKSEKYLNYARKDHDSASNSAQNFTPYTHHGPPFGKI